MKSVGGALSGAFGVVGRFVPALAGVAGGMEAFKRAVGGTQTTMDAFAKIQMQAKSAVDGFFESVARGNLGDFVSSLGDIIDKAGTLADALDRLDTLKIRSAGHMSDLDLRIDQLRKDAFDAQRAKDAEKVKQINAQINGLLEKQNQLYDIQSKAAADAAVAHLRNSLKGGDMSREQFMAMTDPANEDRLNANADRYRDVLRKSQETRAKTTYGGQAAITTLVPTEEAVAAQKQLNGMNGSLEHLSYLINENKTDFKEFYDILKEANEFEQKYIQGYMSLTKEMDKNLKKASRGDSHSAKTKADEIFPPGSMAELERRISELSKKLSLETSEQMRIHIQKEINELKKEKYWIEFGVKFNTTEQLIKSPELTQPKIRNVAEDLRSGHIKAPEPVKSEVIKSNLDYADSLDTINSLLGLMGGLVDNTAQSWVSYVATVAGALAKLLPQLAAMFAASAASGVADKAKLPFPYNIIAMAGTAAGLISAIASIPKFADGGIVGGNSYVGDRLFARVNSGEMILNRNQQTNLLSLTGGSGGGGNVTFTLRGDELAGAIQNYYKMNRR